MMETASGRLKGGITIVRCAPGTRHRACKVALRRAERGNGPAIIITHTRPRAPGAEIQLALPAGQPLTAEARHHLDEAFELWAVAAWLTPRATSVVHARGARWAWVVPSVLESFIEDVVHHLAFAPPPRATDRLAR